MYYLQRSWILGYDVFLWKYWGPVHLPEQQFIGRKKSGHYIFSKIINFKYQIISFLPRWAWHPHWKQRVLEESSGSISKKSTIISVKHLVNNLASQDPGQCGEPRQLALLLRRRVWASQEVIRKRPKWQNWPPSDQSQPDWPKWPTSDHTSWIHIHFQENTCLLNKMIAV